MSTKSDKTLSNLSQDSHVKNSNVPQPFGVLLRQAGLVSSEQIEIALRQQHQQYRDKRLGEILILQGWLKPQTVDFLLEELPKVTKHSDRPIGQYLKQAALLNQEQIDVVLSQQQHTQLKFGELVVNNGWLSRNTVDFFLENLVDNYQTSQNKHKPDFNQDLNQKKREFVAKCFKLLNLKRKNDFALRLIDEIYIWTGGEAFLTEKLCEFIANSFMTAGEEAESVENLVHTKIIINWETNEAATHLIAIKNNLLNNQQCEPFRLLKLYQKVLLQQPIDDEEDLERTQLIDLGLVVEHQGKLMVANRIYQSVFNQSWVAQALANILNRTLAEASSLVLAQPTSSTIVHHPQPSKKLKSQKISKIFLVLLIFGGIATLLTAFLRDIKIRRLFHQGNQLLSQKAYQEAIIQYDHLLRIDSNYYQAWTNRGYALAGLKEYDRMFQSCHTATIIEPQAVYAWNCKGESLHSLQRHLEAVTAFDRAIELDASDPAFLINRSESLAALKLYDESLTAIERAIAFLESGNDNTDTKNARELAIAFNYQGKALVRQQKYQEAIASYERALSYNPKYFPAQIGKGIALFKLEKYAAANREFEQILAQQQLTNAQKAATWFYIGKTLCESAQNLAATIAFNEALRLKPNYQAAKQAREACDP